MEIPAFTRLWTVSVSLWLQLQSIHPSASFPLVFLPQTEKRYRVPQWDVLRSQTACWAQGERLQRLCGFALMVYNYSQINYPRQAVVLLQTIRGFFCAEHNNTTQHRPVSTLSPTTLSLSKCLCSACLVSSPPSSVT